MDDFALFVCGVVVTLIAGMGVITSQVFMGYSKHVTKPTEEAKAKNDNTETDKPVTFRRIKIITAIKLFGLWPIVLAWCFHHQIKVLVSI